MRTVEQIRSEGFEALVKALGATDAVRFIQQFSTGYGDYTKDRHNWLEQKSFEELARPPQKT